MKKIIFSKKVWIEKAIENWSVKKVAKKLGLKLTYNWYPDISDQEVEVWENIPEPWNADEVSFKRAFSNYWKKTIEGNFMAKPCMNYLHNIKSV